MEKEVPVRIAVTPGAAAAVPATRIRVRQVQQVLQVLPDRQGRQARQG